jgi:hypothetical protein
MENTTVSSFVSRESSVTVDAPVSSDARILLDVSCDEDREWHDPAFCAAMIEKRQRESSERLEALCQESEVMNETVRRAYELMALERAVQAQADEFIDHLLREGSVIYERPTIEVDISELEDDHERPTLIPLAA